ncbi:ABC transporter ATP-binding protein [Arthrobacter alpinus]|nr:ABC transporter ATP-binding protein [Arthrobacter alpinus]
MGESGSGKTQTAWSVLDLLPREAMILGGSITIDGQDRAKLPAGRRRALLGDTLAYIPQEPMSNLDPSFTVGQQLTLPLRRTMGMSRGEANAKALALLERVGIADPERTFNSYPHQISGGMAQRVLIAGAVSCEPKVLVADEPTTALDVTVQAEVLDLLRSLQQERGMAMLLVTHNFGVVADICDRVAVMQHGRIVETGDVAEIFAAPKHPYTRMLLGSLLHEREPRTRLVDSEQPLEASV